MLGKTTMIGSLVTKNTFKDRVQTISSWSMMTIKRSVRSLIAPTIKSVGTTENVSIRLTVTMRIIRQDDLQGFVPFGIILEFKLSVMKSWVGVKLLDKNPATDGNDQN